MRYIIWDFDGTLAQRPGMWSQCIADLVNSEFCSLQVLREQISPFLATGFPWHAPDRTHPHLSVPDVWWSEIQDVLVRAITLGADVDAAKARLIGAKVRAAYLDPAAWRVFEDTRPALEGLAADGWNHLILSNHVPELEELVGALVLRPFFRAVLSSAKTGFEKPHPGAFGAALSLIPPEARTVVVGDSFSADFLGARAVGLDAILVRAPHAGCDSYEPDLLGVVARLGGALDRS